MNLGAPTPYRSAQPTKPTLMPARGVPHSHTTADITGRTELFHVDAKSEFNAIDRAVDVTSRFVDQNLLQDFNTNLLGFADDGSRPF